MKKILFILFGFAAASLFTISCKGKVIQSPKTVSTKMVSTIDFSKVQTISSSAALFEEAKGYAFDSAKAVVFDYRDVFHYMDSVNIIFYVDQKKDIRVEFQIPGPIGTDVRSYVVEFMVVLSGTLSSNDNKFVVGGDDQILGIKPTVCLIFNNTENALRVAKIINNWHNQLPEQQPSAHQKKGTDV